MVIGTVGERHRWDCRLSFLPIAYARPASGMVELRKVYRGLGGWEGGKFQRLVVGNDPGNFPERVYSRYDRKQ